MFAAYAQRELPPTEKPRRNGRGFHSLANSRSPSSKGAGYSRKLRYFAPFLPIFLDCRSVESCRLAAFRRTLASASRACNSAIFTRSSSSISDCFPALFLDLLVTAVPSSAIAAPFVGDDSRMSHTKRGNATGFAVVWDGRRTDAGCTNRPWAAAGSYQVLGRLATKLSEPVALTVST